jgi:hypothetical protein
VDGSLAIMGEARAAGDSAPPAAVICFAIFMVDAAIAMFVIDLVWKCMKIIMMVMGIA